MGEIRDMAPILLGHRKRFIEYSYLVDCLQKREQRGTIATTVAGIERGADIVRVHDVRANKRAVSCGGCNYQKII